VQHRALFIDLRGQKQQQRVIRGCLKAKS
jgi:hypothetical protein